MKDLELIIFDLDGTLIDAYPAITSSFNYTMRKLSRPAQPAKVIRRAVGWGDGLLLKPFVAEGSLSKALSLYRRHHKQALIKYSRLLPGANTLLKELRAKGYKLAVASNRPTKFSLILMRHLKIAKFFDYYLCADKLKHGKPHPEILNTIVKKLKVKKSRALYVGDMGIDAKAAKRAKIKCVIVTGGSSSRKEIVKEKPYLIIKDIKRLSDLL